MKGAMLQVYWPDEWEKIKAGLPCWYAGCGYVYEGEHLDDIWSFNSGFVGEVVVKYNDGGVGFEGELSDIDIKEYEYSRESVEALKKQYDIKCRQSDNQSEDI